MWRATYAELLPEGLLNFASIPRGQIIVLFLPFKSITKCNLSVECLVKSRVSAGWFYSNTLPEGHDINFLLTLTFEIQFNFSLFSIHPIQLRSCPRDGSWGGCSELGLRLNIWRMTIEMGEIASPSLCLTQLGTTSPGIRCQMYFSILFSDNTK